MSAAAVSDIELPTSVLDGYTGYYQMSDSLVINVTRSGQQLSAQLTGQPPAAIFPESATAFFFRIVDAQIDFVTDASGRATALVLHQHGRDHTATRIDAALAHQIAGVVDARIQAQTPAPGSEAAVRRLLAALASGAPNYQDMTPALASATRQQLLQIQASLANLGAVESIDFQGVGSQGWDLYQVRHAHGISQVRIQLDANGIISGALLSAGP